MPVPDEDTDWPSIVVYGAYWCQDTMRTLSFLNHHDVPYEFVDVEEDREAAQQVMAWNEGLLSTPTLDIDGHVVTEPSDETLAELLGVAS